MLSIHDTRFDFAQSRCVTAVLPIGALEQHGKHLPVGTDLMLAQDLAGPVAKALAAYLLPPLPITSSIEHRKARGTVYLRSDTLALVIRDIAESLRRSGFTRLILVNFHGGNWILKPTVRQLNRDGEHFRTVLINPDLSPAQWTAIFEHTAGDVHGGEFETSLMLHLHPEEVRKLPATTRRSFPPQAFLDYFDATELTDLGHWGWPRAATADKGRRAMKELIASALRLVRQIEDTARQIARRGRAADDQKPPTRRRSTRQSHPRRPSASP